MQEYIVQQGDILGKIAQQYNISLRDLLKLNRESGNEIKDPDKIFVGQRIKVPGTDTTPIGGKDKTVKPDHHRGKEPEPAPITKEQYVNHYMEQATLAAMGSGEYKSKITSTLDSAERLHADYIAPINEALEKKRNFLKSLEGPQLEKYKKELSAIIDGIDEAEKYFSKDPEEHIKGFRFDDHKNIKHDLLGEDLRLMSMIEIGVAYGVDFIPKTLAAIEGEDGAAPGQRFMVAMLRKSEQIRKKLNLGGKPEPYWNQTINKTGSSYNPDFAKAWGAAAQEFIKAPGIQEGNKVIQEYILKNTLQPPKDASIIEIIADEVNETLNNLPEIQLASEVLSEDELKELFAPLAKQVVVRVHGQIGQKIKGMVAEEITPDELQAVINAFGGINTLSDEERLAVLAIIRREDPDSVTADLSDEAQDNTFDTMEDPED